jgi:uncharacterized lipoprotein NlpE involved in copper resistance
MRIFAKALLPLTLTLAACSPVEEEAAPAEEAMEAVVEAAPLAPDGGPFAGTFELTDEEGNTYQAVMNADGTFSVDNVEGGVNTGTYEVNETGFCAVSDNEEGNTGCIVSSEAGEDGSWVNTLDDGMVRTVRRVVEAAE